MENKKVLLPEYKLNGVTEYSFREIFLNHNAIMLLIDPVSGKIVDANNSAEKFYGYTIEELCSMSIDDINTMKPEEIASERTKAFNEERNYFIFYHRLFSGEIRTVEVNSSPIKINNRNFLFSIIHDISIRKNVLDSVHLSEEKYRTVVSAANDAIILQERSGKILTWNKAAENIFGYNAVDIVGKEASKRYFVTYTEDGSLLETEDHPSYKTFETGKPCKDVIIGVNNLQANKYYWITVNTIPLFKKNESLPYAVIITCTDITELYKTEQIYKSRLTLLEFANTHTVKELMQKTLDEIEILTDSSIGFFHFMSEDEKSLSHQMWSTNTLMNMCSAKPGSKHYSLELAGIWAECARENKVIIHNDFNNVPGKKGMPEGHSAIYREITAPISRNGKVVGILGIGNKQSDYDDGDVGVATQLADLAWDIAEKIIAQEKLRESEEKLRILNEDKDKFFSIIAHDLRSPFTVFLGMSELMSENISRYSIKELTGISKSLNRTANSLFKLLNNLLEWSLMQRGITKFNPVEISLMKSINDCFTEEKELIESKEINLEYEVFDDTKVFADVNMLGTILRNLLTNAVKFSNRKGNIKISAKLIDNNFVEISVCDNGIGMNNNLVGNLFKIDSKVKRKGTEGEISSGLGLLLCKDFVEKHNGNIWAESEVGKGSRFCFTLKSQEN